MPTARAELVLSGVTCGCEEQTPGTDEVPTEGGWQHLRGALLRSRGQLSRERHTHGESQQPYYTRSPVISM